MSFVSKGEKKMHNMAKGSGPGADKAASKDSFGKKGQPKNHNVAPASKNKAAESVSEDADKLSPDAKKVVDSEYDPASGKRAKSVADLRNAAKLVQKRINEKSSAGSDSPTGSEGGQDAKHNSSKNESGFMQGKGKSMMEKSSQKAPKKPADQMKDPMEDPFDQDQVDNGQYKEGMTPKGKNRMKSSSLRAIKRKFEVEMD